MRIAINWWKDEPVIPFQVVTICITVFVFCFACATLRVGHEDPAVTDPYLAVSTMAIEDAEEAALGLLSFMVDLALGAPDDKGVMDTFEWYALVIEPGIQTILDSARAALGIYAESQTSENKDKVELWLLTLASILDQAEKIAQEYGME